MKKVFVAFAAIAILISCKTTEKASAKSEASKPQVNIEKIFVESNTWELSSFNGKLPADVGFKDKIPTLVLNLAEKRVGGNSGCNSFGGEAIIEGDTLTIDKVMSTKMYCDGVPEFEFFSTLQQPLKYTIDGNKLLLEKDDKVVLEYTLIGK